MDADMKKKLGKEPKIIRKPISGLEGSEKRFVCPEDRVQYHLAFLYLIIESLPNPFYVVDTKDYTIKIATSAAQFGQI